MGKLVAVAAVLLGACQPMYGQKPERIKNPPIVQNGTKGASVPVEALVYIEDCPGESWAKPAAATPPKRDRKVAERRVQEGDASFAQVTTAPSADAQGAALIHSIESYSDALRKDPFDPEATLKLAIAYDKAQRKGCAIAMLRRLSHLAENPKFADAAEPAIDSVVDHDGWFRAYRRDAKTAIGR